MRGFLGKIFKRRQMIVSALQCRLLVGNFVYLIALFLILAPAFLLPLILAVENPALSGVEREEAASRILTLQALVWIGAPLVLALCLAHSLIVSHRIAGPLFRLNRMFKSLGDGDLSMSVRIRRKDYLWDEARSLDEMVGGLARKVQTAKESCQEASTTLPDLIDAVGRGDRHDSVVLAGRLGAQLEFLGRQLGEFKLPETDAVDTDPVVLALQEEMRDSAPVASA